MAAVACLRCRASRAGIGNPASHTCNNTAAEISTRSLLSHQPIAAPGALSTFSGSYPQTCGDSFQHRERTKLCGSRELEPLLVCLRPCHGCGTALLHLGVGRSCSERMQSPNAATEPCRRRSLFFFFLFLQAPLVSRLHMLRSAKHPRPTSRVLHTHWCSRAPCQPSARCPNTPPLRLSCSHFLFSFQECMTYSIGFRAPAKRDLVTFFSDHVALRKTKADDFYGDPDLERQASYGGWGQVPTV